MAPGGHAPGLGGRFPGPVVIVLLNGPLGAGKSTLAEALAERLPSSVWLNGDGLVALNPPPPDEGRHLHATIKLLVDHHGSRGYRHFVIDHLWTEPEELEDLRERLKEVDPSAEIRCFLLTVSAEENLRRIKRRAAARAVDELAFELRTVLRERSALSTRPEGVLGEPFDAGSPPAELVERLLERLGKAAR